MVDLGQEIAASGGAPPPEMQDRMEAIGRHLELHGKIDLIVLIPAVI